MPVVPDRVVAESRAFEPGPELLVIWASVYYLEQQALGVAFRRGLLLR